MDPLLAVMGEEPNEDQRAMLAQMLRGEAAAGGALSTSSIPEVAAQGQAMQRQAQETGEYIGLQQAKREQVRSIERQNALSNARRAAEATRRAAERDKDRWASKMSSSNVEKLIQEGTINNQQMQLLDDWTPNFNTQVLGGVMQAAVNMGIPMGEEIESAAAYWKSYADWENQVRKELFGSALTGFEIKAWERSNLTPKLDPAVARNFINIRKKLLEKGYATKAAIRLSTGVPEDVVRRTYPLPDEAWDDLDGFADKRSREAREWYQSKSAASNPEDLPREVDLNYLQTADDDVLRRMSDQMGYGR